MIALAVLTAAIANVAFVVLLADRFGNEGVHASAGELTSLQANGRAVPAGSYTLANENTVTAATKIAA